MTVIDWAVVLDVRGTVLDTLGISVVSSGWVRLRLCILVGRNIGHLPDLRDQAAVAFSSVGSRPCCTAKRLAAALLEVSILE